MKLRLITTVCAVLAVAACNNSPDEELSDEALSMDDVVAEAADLEMTLSPGEYRSTSELVSFEIEGLSPQMQQMAEAAFADGAGAGHTYCVTEEMTAEDWLSQMNESECTVTSLDGSSEGIDAVLQCSDPEGMNGRVELAGNADGDSANMDVRFDVDIPGMGTGRIHMRSASERIGDCG